MDTTYDLTFAELRRVNVDRCVNAFCHSLESWSLADWGVAYGGKVGEALNVIKKLNRARDGLAGNSVDTATLHRMLADELADAVIYADLLAARIGVDLESIADAVGFADYRHATISEMQHLPTSTPMSNLGAQALRRAGMLAHASTFVGDARFIGNVIEVTLADALRTLDLIAVGAGIDLGAAVIAKFNATSEKLGFPQRLGVPDPALLANQEA